MLMAVYSPVLCIRMGIDRKLTDYSQITHRLSLYEINAPRSGSSHYTFRKAGCQPITIPKHEPIKKIYVEMVKQIVESEAKNDEDTE